MTGPIEVYITRILAALGSQDPLEVLRETPAALRNAVAGITADQLSTPEGPDKWSVRQVVQHLADAELVGAYRYRMILTHDAPPLLGYDQDAWCQRLHYDESDVETALGDFATLRRANLRVLERTTPAERARFGVHAERGVESVSLMMRLYAGHDVVHLRQIGRVCRAIGADRVPVR